MTLNPFIIIAFELGWLHCALTVIAVRIIRRPVPTPRATKTNKDMQ